MEGLNESLEVEGEGAEGCSGNRGASESWKRRVEVEVESGGWVAVEVAVDWRSGGLKRKEWRSGGLKRKEWKLWSTFLHSQPESGGWVAVEVAVDRRSGGLKRKEWKLSGPLSSTLNLCSQLPHSTSAPNFHTQPLLPPSAPFCSPLLLLLPLSTSTLPLLTSAIIAQPNSPTQWRTHGQAHVFSFVSAIILCIALLYLASIYRQSDFENPITSCCLWHICPPHISTTKPPIP